MVDKKWVEDRVNHWKVNYFLMQQCTESKHAWVSTWLCVCKKLLACWEAKREKEKERNMCGHTQWTSKNRKPVYSQSKWQIWRCWIAGRTPGRHAAQDSRCSRGSLGQVKGRQRWSWAGSREKGWARPTRRRSRSCKGCRTLHGSPSSPCCCSASCTGTGEKRRGELREREERGSTQVEVLERQGLRVLKRGRITQRELREMYVCVMLHVCGYMCNCPGSCPQCAFYECVWLIIKHLTG